MQAPARDVSLSDVAGLDARIRIDRFVAEGGFGRVYKGHHRTLDRDVAIKVLKIPAEYGDGAPDSRTAAPPAQPPAPSLAPGGGGGPPRRPPPPPRRKEGRLFDRDETLQLLTPVLEAVAMAHAQGIVHRDITPGNLMLVETPTGPALRLLD